MRKIFAMVFTVALLVTTVFAVNMVPVAAAAAPKPVIEDVDYEGNGKVEIDFVGKVDWKNPKVQVKDNGGKTYRVSAVKKDNDEIEFRVIGIKKNRKYTVTISGVKKKAASSYTTVKTTFSVGNSITPNTKAAIEKTEYEGNGYVDVDFRRDVRWKNPKVTVKDSSGKKYRVTIVDFDDDDINFRVSNIQAGKTYTYTISGVRDWKGGSYGSVSGKFTTPKVSSSVKVKKAKLDWEDRELSIDFNKDVYLDNARITVKDSSGKSYKANIVDWDDDELEVHMPNLKAGKKYTYKVTGIVAYGASKAASVSGSFSTPASTSARVTDVEYDWDDEELSIEFNKSVDLSRAKIIVKDSSGKSYKAIVIDWDRDEIEARVPGLKIGKKYTFSVSGIKLNGVSKTVKGSFRVFD